MKLDRILLTIAGGLALAVICLMAWDYNERPFDPGNDRIGNPRYSLILYPALVIIEFLLAWITLRFLQNSRLITSFALILFWCGITACAFIDTLRGGGVLAAHAMWLSVVSVLLIIFTALRVIRNNRTAQNS